MKLNIVIAIGFVGGGGSLLRAGEFINLDFSQPDLTGLQYDSVRDAYYGNPERIVPGWLIAQDQVPVSRVWVTEGGTWGPVTLEVLGHGSGADRYRLSYDSEMLPGDLRSTSLRQTATIPEWAVALEFFWNGDKLSPSPLHVDGQRWPISVASGFDYTADMSQWAGREVTLSFEFPARGVGYLADLRFTVPEPSTWALLGVGGAGLGWLALRGRKRR